MVLCLKLHFFSFCKFQILKEIYKNSAFIHLWLKQKDREFTLQLNVLNAELPIFSVLLEFQDI
jgi:hypothetical protein